jgi:hypothetical protein
MISDQASSKRSLLTPEQLPLSAQIPIAAAMQLCRVSESLTRERTVARAGSARATPGLL